MRCGFSSRASVSEHEQSSPGDPLAAGDSSCDRRRVGHAGAGYRRQYRDLQFHRRSAARTSGVPARGPSRQPVGASAVRPAQRHDDAQLPGLRAESCLRIGRRDDDVLRSGCPEQRLSANSDQHLSCLRIVFRHLRDTRCPGTDIQRRRRSGGDGSRRGPQPSALGLAVRRRSVGCRPLDPVER